MIITKMFSDDINRKINGVIKVDQSSEDMLRQELNEYIITNELRKHFITFFTNYCDAFDEPTYDIGVWISGFFGSGKSHFLKMLAYLLENKPAAGISPIECFREKFKDDPGFFMKIDKSLSHPTETILFNIDYESSIRTDQTAVLRVFAKMFYKHLGLYGDDLKVTMMERHLQKEGKFDRFREIYMGLRHSAWETDRRGYEFFGDWLIPALTGSLGISEDDANAWFHNKTPADFSIAQFVGDIKEYTDSKPADFRLLFMIDEVGQYVGTDTNKLLNLQSIVEKIGSECGGKVWVVCTGQEAIDSIIKVRTDEFSRIQARFHTRLSLSSSSVDEVIQKRILKKNDEAAALLEGVYERSDSVLRNIFTFNNAVLDMKGFSGPSDFTDNFPFIPYQFTIIQKVFAEIRKHGNSGKHLSGGERSMLSGFQEAVQKIQERDEYALIPFHLFYDTVHTFLDSSIRRVVERCQKAAVNGDGICPVDVDVLKLLYLVRYIQDIPANIDNIAVLMVDNINVDKIEIRKEITESLNRLLKQNYIGRVGDIYNFLTDEEQDIQREINNTNIDTSEIVSSIGKMIFGDILTTKKLRRRNSDFQFDQITDEGSSASNMVLRIVTEAADPEKKQELYLRTQSKGHEAIVVLADTHYYESVETAMKIRKYVKQQNNLAQKPVSIQNIIRSQQEKASKSEDDAIDELKTAILRAEFYADGEHLLTLTGDSAKGKIEQALSYLADHVYEKLNCIDKNYNSDDEILKILDKTDSYIEGTVPNQNAMSEVEKFLECHEKRHLPTSMFDIQSKYQSAPYGWKEIDIAAVVAWLIRKQKVTVKHAGNVIRADDPRLIDMLRKKSEIGRTLIALRILVEESSIRRVQDIMRSYCTEIVQFPKDEDGLIASVCDRLSRQKADYERLAEQYGDHRYPGRDIVQNAVGLLADLLSKREEHKAFIDDLIKREDDLLDSREDMEDVENFFKNQAPIFDKADALIRRLRNDRVCLREAEPQAAEACEEIESILKMQKKDGIYRKIPELPRLMNAVHAGHDRLITEKKSELRTIVQNCRRELTAHAGDCDACRPVIENALSELSEREKEIARFDTLTTLAGFKQQIFDFNDAARIKIDIAKQPPKPREIRGEAAKTARPAERAPLNIKKLYRMTAFPAKTLTSQQEVNDYVEQIRKYLLDELNDCDAVTLN